MDISSVIEFTRLLNKFQEIERIVHMPGRDRYENDAEHSYQLALLAWYILSKDSLDLDKELVIGYALVHDLVEVYAGDTYTYLEGEQVQVDKRKREAEAAIRLKKEFPEFADLHVLIENYEHKKDKESRFVYALDKIHPIINIYLTGGKTWKEGGITLLQMIENKKAKVAVSPEVEVYFNALLEILKKEEIALFAKK